MDRITWGGHATVRIDLGAVALLTDPLLRRRTAHLLRAAPVPQGITAGLAAVLVSHLHHDHLDLASLRMIHPDVPVVVPAGTGRILRRAAVREVLELAPGDEARFGTVTVRATHAAHDGGRPPARRRHTPALGFLVSDGIRRVYFAGDTDVFPGMADICDRIDVALLPVWGWGPSLGAGHLDPEGAARALRLLRPRMAVPIHWGTVHPAWMIPGRRGFLRWPGPRFAAAAAREAPDVTVRVLSPGESMPLEPAPGGGGASR